MHLEKYSVLSLLAADISDNAEDYSKMKYITFSSQPMIIQSMVPRFTFVEFFALSWQVL